MVLEVPAGIAVLFPSALITHFNVDLIDPLPGEISTRQSAVWFSQAVLQQFSQLGEMVRSARAANRSTIANWIGFRFGLDRTRDN